MTNSSVEGSSESPPKPRGRFRVLTILLPLAGLLVAGLVMFGEFSYFSVCRVCGQVRHSTQLQLPLTEVTYWTFNRDEATAVSKFLVSRELVRQHKHEWVFGHGGGNGRSASGPALMMLSRLNSEDEVRFLDILLKFGKKAEAEKWAQRFTDPRYRGFFPFPPDRELLTDKDFDAWWTVNMEFCKP